MVIVALFAEQPVPTSWCQSGQWGQGGEAVMMSQVLTGLTEPGQELKKKKSNKICWKEVNIILT